MSCTEGFGTLMCLGCSHSEGASWDLCVKSLGPRTSGVDGTRRMMGSVLMEDSHTDLWSASDQPQQSV